MSKFTFLALFLWMLAIVSWIGAVWLPWWWVTGIFFGLLLLGQGCYRLGARNGRRMILHNSRLEYLALPELREREPGEFGDDRRGYYQEVQQQLELLGFRVLGDFVDARQARSLPPTRGFVRYALSADGTIVAEWAQLLLPWYWRILAALFSASPRILAFTSRLDDDTVLGVLNQPGVAHKSQPESFHLLTLPRDTAPEALFRFFCEKREKYLRENPERRSVVLAGREALLQMETRRAEAIREFRLRVGVVTLQDLRANCRQEATVQTEFEALRRLAGDRDPIL